MDADTFAQRLAQCAPSLEAIQARGLSPQGVLNRAASYQVTRVAPATPDLDPLEDLSRNFKSDKVEIGMITFVPQEPAVPIGRVVGEFEAYPLCISYETGEVLVVELWPVLRVQSQCALTGARFLDAAEQAACYLSKSNYDSSFEWDDSTTAAQAEECAEAAGGPVYRDFWFMLFGM